MNRSLNLLKCFGQFSFTTISKNTIQTEKINRSKNLEGKLAMKKLQKIDIKIKKFLSVITIASPLFLAGKSVNAATYICNLKSGNQPVFNSQWKQVDSVSGSVRLENFDKSRINVSGGYHTVYKLKDSPDRYIDIDQCQNLSALSTSPPIQSK